ncbi:RIP metalloprotease RseP [Marinomonas rhizomae]|uniref:Zinc metalloprotease n=1 Tax=Marinomonas rhizomae TaxID=491948 RepID=A0A366J4P5_9GAMM|nr:RIP metalloprotease RseP [Marinomonas rhizomae]RBP81892.1 regulator of sigma E protease [Marinomonas rhizomae]RNF73008.1 RIP metalloprotease RseP [Marinomonas rhizomae]
MIQNVLSIVVALGLLITFHEFGHFFVARRCGVKVLRFSVGFGKPIYRYVGKTGTEYTLAMIPLGGYVRMLDEREGNVPAELRAQAFNTKNVWQRIAIVAAGPVANFILAIAIYALVALLGVQSIAPKVGQIEQNSPVAQTQIQPGDELISVAGESVVSWEDVNLVLAGLIGKTGTIIVRYQPEGMSSLQEDKIQLNRWLVGDEPNNLIRAFGLSPWQPIVTPIIAQVVADGAASVAGFQAGDEILSIGNRPVSSWQQVVAVVQANPSRELVVEVQRSQDVIELLLLPKSTEKNGKVIGYAGLAVVPPKWDENLIRERHYGPVESLSYGVAQTYKMVSLTISSIGKMLQGLISVDNLSGPITIAKVASASADSGLQSFLKFMAYLSVSLGVLNLLPIPMLDGGHLLFFGIEAIRRKPVSEKIQNMAYRVGASLLFALMAVAIFNDIARL